MSGFFDFFSLDYIGCKFDNSDCHCRKSCIKNIDEIDNEHFRLFVKEVKRIDSDIVIFVQFRSKESDFDIDLGKSIITLTDAKGKEITLNGCKISNFHIYSGEAKVFPFVFKNMAKSMKQPYKLRLELYNSDTIVLKNIHLGDRSVEY